MEKEYATLKDVAKKAGTTASTVSYVLNKSKTRYISDEMRQRVLNAAAELNYVKSSLASSLKKGNKRKIIAVLVPQFYNRYFTRMVLAIELIADKHDYILTICNTFDDPIREKEIITRLAQHRVDGYIIAPTSAGAANTAFLREKNIPLVIVDRSLENVSDYYFVSNDQYKCGYKGGHYLAKSGHKKIAYISWDTVLSDLSERDHGFIDSMSENGLNEEQVITVSGDFSDKAGYRMTKQLLTTHSDITAIFYGYNIQARGGIQYIFEQNLQVGHDMSVILIGSPEWAISGQNNFAHIDQHEYELGERAVKILFKLINNNIINEEKKIIQDCTLYEGTSVAKIIG